MPSDTLFTTFSKNLTLYNPNHQDTFLCPLQVSPECQKFYPRKDIGKLNRAHIWQESLGGKQWTLACKNCNSFIGTELESHASNRAKFVRSEKLRGRLEYKGVKGSLGGMVRLTDDITFEVLNEISNPHTIAEMRKSYYVDDSPNLQFTIDGGFELRRVSLSYLHFAYLFLFHEYGYEWFFTPLARRIRNQLSHLEEQAFEIPWTVVQPDIPSVEASSAQHLFVEFSYSLRGFQVVSPQLEHEQGNRVAVIFFVTQLSIHDSKTSSVLPPKYFAGLRVRASVPTCGSNEHLAYQKWRLRRAWLNVFSH